jgi:cytochrome c2
MSARVFRVLAAAIACALSAWAADAQRGREVLEREGCLQCHHVRGEGQRLAPDLAEKLVYRYSPSALASMIWNHTPEMWEQMSNQVLARPLAGDRDWEDLFAYLYSLRIFDEAGNSNRGQRVFERKGCANCHTLTGPAASTGTPVSQWARMDDPITLLQQMWNHASLMRNANALNRRDWQTLSSREFQDLTAYVQSRQNISAADAARRFTLPDPADGEALFKAHCVECHQGTMSFETRLGNKSLVDIGAGMWNHFPRMLAVPVVSAGEMRAIISFVWERQYLGGAGDIGRGREAFEKKRCASCHNDPATGASRMTRGEKVFTPFSMVALGWVHGRQMHQAMKEQGIRWPYLSPKDISDLIAYINSRP